MQKRIEHNLVQMLHIRLNQLQFHSHLYAQGCRDTAIKSRQGSYWLVCVQHTCPRDNICVRYLLPYQMYNWEFRQRYFLPWLLQQLPFRWVLKMECVCSKRKWVIVAFWGNRRMNLIILFDYGDAEPNDSLENQVLHQFLCLVNALKIHRNCTMP